MYFVGVGWPFGLSNSFPPWLCPLVVHLHSLNFIEHTLNCCCNEPANVFVFDRFSILALKKQQTYSKLSWSYTLYYNFFLHWFTCQSIQIQSFLFLTSFVVIHHKDKSYHSWSAVHWDLEGRLSGVLKFGIWWMQHLKNKKNSMCLHKQQNLQGISLTE